MKSSRYLMGVVKASAGIPNTLIPLSLVSSIILLPFIQTGVSFYLSGATAILFIILSGHPWLIRPRATSVSLAAWFAFAGMFLSLFTSYSADLNHGFLRVLREGIFFLALVNALSNYSDHKFEPKVLRQASMTLCIIAIGFLVIVITQRVALLRGIYIGFPKQWFVQNGELIPDLLALKFSKIRPSGTFGEPSYLAFVCSAIFTISLSRINEGRTYLISVLAAAIAGILSQSASFYIFLFLMLYMKYIYGRSYFIQVASIIMIILLLPLLGTFTVIGQRFLGASGGINGFDSSAYARIVGPLTVLPRYLASHPFGAEFSSIPFELSTTVSALRFHGTEYLHNALFNLAFCYGVVGIAAYGILMMSVKDWYIRRYITLAMFFNGAFLSPDKVAVVMLVLLMYQKSSRSIKA